MPETIKGFCVKFKGRLFKSTFHEDQFTTKAIFLANFMASGDDWESMVESGDAVIVPAQIKEGWE
jgi:hypothetical protein